MTKQMCTQKLPLSNMRYSSDAAAFWLTRGFHDLEWFMRRRVESVPCRCLTADLPFFVNLLVALAPILISGLFVGLCRGTTNYLSKQQHVINLQNEVEKLASGIKFIRICHGLLALSSKFFGEQNAPLLASMESLLHPSFIFRD